MQILKDIETELNDYNNATELKIDELLGYVEVAHELLGKCHDRLSKETKVYVIEVDDKGSDDYTDEKFMTLAEEQGTVYSLKGFQDDFNYDENIATESKYIRILTN